jgi:hypothetical protein
MISMNSANNEHGFFLFGSDGVRALFGRELGLTRYSVIGYVSVETLKGGSHAGRD